MAISDKDRALFLATLPFDMAVEFVKRQAEGQIVHWLDMALECGAFDVSGDVFRFSGDPSFDIDDVEAMFGAAFGFLSGAKVGLEANDPIFGPQKRQYMLLDLQATDTFRAWYRRLVDRFVVDTEGLEARLTELGAVLPLGPRLERLQTKLMCGAIALAMPQELARLARAYPSALTHTVRSVELGKLEAEVGSEMALTPYGVAIHFSRSECMDIISAALPGRVAAVGQRANSKLEFGLHFDASLLHCGNAPPCHPGIYAKALLDRDLALAGSSASTLDSMPKEAIADKAIEVIGGGAFSSALRAHLPAFLAAGVYDADPFAPLERPSST